MAWLVCELEALDIDRARELIDGFASDDAPYRTSRGSSWFEDEADRRSYWFERAPDVMRWARDHGFALPAAAIYYGLPEDDTETNETAAVWPDTA